MFHLNLISRERLKLLTKCFTTKLFRSKGGITYRANNLWFQNNGKYKDNIKEKKSMKE